MTYYLYYNKYNVHYFMEWDTYNHQEFSNGHQVFEFLLHNMQPGDTLHWVEDFL